MKTARWPGLVAALLLVSAAGLPVHAEDSAPTQDPGLPRVLRFGITDNQIDLRTLTRDDLREVPSPRLDRQPPQVRVTVIEGDPICLPHRDIWVGPASATGHLPGVGRPR